MRGADPRFAPSSLALLFRPEGVQGDRVTIARPSLESADEFAQAVNESREELAPWFPYARKELGTSTARELGNLTRQQFDWIALNATSVTRRNELTYFMTDRFKTRFVGVFVLRNILFSEGSIEFGYWIRTSMHRMGYATEAIGAMRALIRQTGCFHKIILQISPRNQGSLALAESLGFQRVRAAENAEGVHEFYTTP